MPAPRAEDQINLTDPDSRILPVRRVGASSKATTPKRRWIPTRCWWSPRGVAPPATALQPPLRPCKHQVLGPLQPPPLLGFGPVDQSARHPPAPPGRLVVAHARERGAAHLRIAVSLRPCSRPIQARAISSDKGFSTVHGVRPPSRRGAGLDRLARAGCEPRKRAIRVQVERTLRYSIASSTSVQTRASLFSPGALVPEGSLKLQGGCN